METILTPLMKDNIFTTVFFAPSGTPFPEGMEVAPKWEESLLIGSVWNPNTQTWTPSSTPPRKRGTAREFMALFTKAEKLAIVNLSMSDADIKLWYNEALAGEVWLDHPDVALGLNAMKQEGVITAERVDEILETDFNA